MVYAVTIVMGLPLASLFARRLLRPPALPLGGWCLALLLGLLAALLWVLLCDRDAPATVPRPLAPPPAAAAVK